MDTKKKYSTLTHFIYKNRNYVNVIYKYFVSDERMGRAL